MILETKTDTLIMEEGEVQESTQMEIDKDSHIFLMRMLSKFYSDGIGSLIRETCSNALDSHRECGSNEPIIVSLKPNPNGNYEFTVEDFGCGIDDQDVENIIKKYGKSTKRASVNQLGAFGLGFKSPLAYNSSFYFVGRKNGIERKWMLYESDDESNKIDLLHEGPTKEKNGVKIIVPVKAGDKINFYDKIREQLAYFENVYFDCGYEIINNTVKIVRSEHFQWSSLADTNTLHICLDNVYYPIDFNKLGISPILCPIGLRFSLSDGLFPVPNREQLKYTNEAKTAILNKIREVAEYFVKKYNENIKDTNDLFTVIEHHKYNYRYVTHLSGSGKMDIKGLEKYSNIKFIDPKLTSLKYLSIKRLLEIKDTFTYPYVLKYEYNCGKFTAKKSEYRTKIYFDDLINKRNHIYLFTEMSKLKKTYLKDLIGNQYVRFFRKENRTSLGKKHWRYTGAGTNTYMNLLELWSYPKNEWRDRIKEYQELTAQADACFIDADKIVIPDTWIEARKKERLQAMAVKGTNKRRQKLAGEVNGKVACALERFVSGKNCKFTPTLINMGEASKQKYFTLYGTDDNLIQQLYTIFAKDKVRLVLFSTREIKNLNKVELHNWMEISKFMEGEHIIFKRAVTAYLVNQLMEEYPSIFNKLHILKQVSTSFSADLSTLQTYKHSYYMSGDNTLYLSMIKLAEEKRLFDMPTYVLYNQVKDTIKKLTFLAPLLANLNSYNHNITEGTVGAIRDLFKYYKQRIDWKYYNISVNTEVVKEEELEEELV